VGGALVATGIIAGAALAARWQAGQAAPGSTVVRAPDASGDSARSLAVVPGAAGGAGAPASGAASDGASSGPAPAGAAAPRELTREDSLAIAAAVRDRLEAAHPAPKANASVRALDSVARVLERALGDSVALALRELQRFRVQRAPSVELWTMSPEQLAELRRRARADAGGADAGGDERREPRVRVGGAGGGRGAAATAAPWTSRRRVLVADVRNASGRRELDGVTAAMSHALRERLEAGGVYDVRRPPPDLGAGRSALSLAAQMKAGAVVTPLLVPHGDSLRVQVMVTDVGRGYPVATLAVVAPSDRPLAGMETLVEEVRGTLGALEWGSVAGPPPPAVPAPPAAPRVAPVPPSPLPPL
jgi:hypothetical protein